MMWILIYFFFFVKLSGSLRITAPSVHPLQYCHVLSNLLYIFRGYLKSILTLETIAAVQHY